MDNKEEAVKEKAKKDKKPKEKVDVKREILSYVILLAVVAGVVLIINTFFLINAKIPSGSMENTIMENDQIFGNRLAYKLGADPQRMDIIIFKYPDDESKLFIKRIIGLPDSIDIVNLWMGIPTPETHPVAYQDMIETRD
ncbi:MAG: signal peptidase I, partial [bacterium]